MVCSLHLYDYNDENEVLRCKNVWCDECVTGCGTDKAHKMVTCFTVWRDRRGLKTLQHSIPDRNSNHVSPE